MENCFTLGYSFLHLSPLTHSPVVCFPVGGELYSGAQIGECYPSYLIGCQPFILNLTSEVFSTAGFTVPGIISMHHRDSLVGIACLGAKQLLLHKGICLTGNQAESLGCTWARNHIQVLGNQIITLAFLDPQAGVPAFFEVSLIFPILSSPLDKLNFCLTRAKFSEQ